YINNRKPCRQFVMLFIAKRFALAIHIGIFIFEWIPFVNNTGIQANSGGSVFKGHTVSEIILYALCKVGRCAARGYQAFVIGILLLVVIYIQLVVFALRVVQIFYITIRPGNRFQQF